MFLPAERADAILAAAGRDQFIKMPRSDFEKSVQNAARQLEAEKHPAQIVQANYRANWRSGSLSGTGRWQIQNPTGIAGAIALEPFNPAIENAKWADGTPALLYRGAIPGRAGTATLLWNDGTGGTLDFDWSLRGLDESEESRFELAFPPAPIAALELLLPVDRTPGVAEGQGFITGPFPAGDAPSRLWKLSNCNQGRVELAIRKARTSVGSAKEILSRSAHWSIGATGPIGTIEVALESSRTNLIERKFQLDPELSVNELSGVSVESWRVLGSELFVRWKESLVDPRFTATVSSTSAMVPSNTWLVPTIRMSDAIPGSETVEIQGTPEVKLEHWQPGDFRATASTNKRQTTLLFTAVLLASANDDRHDRKMPTLRYKASDTEFTTEESLDWRIEPGKNSLACTIAIRVIRGPLVALTVQTQPGYVPTNVTAIPDDPGLAWFATPGSPNTWTIEPSKAVAGGGALALKIDARGTVFPRPGHSGDPSPAVLALPFPRIRPIGAAERKLDFSARIAEGLKGTFSASTPGAEFGEGSIRAKFGNRDAEGEANVAAIPPTVSVSQSLTVKRIDALLFGMTSTFQGKIERSLAFGILLTVPGHSEPSVILDGVTVKAKRASLGSAFSFELLSAGFQGLQSLGQIAELQTSPSTVWFVPFPRPSLGEFSLVAEYSVAANVKPGALNLPIASVCGARMLEVRASLDAALAEEFQPPTLPSPFEVELFSRKGIVPVETAKPSGWVIAEAKLLNRIDAAGNILCTLSGRVVEAAGPNLEIQHSGGFGILEGVSVGSHEVPMPVGRPRDGVRIPVSGAGVQFEIRYRIPRDHRFAIAANLNVGEPQIPGVERIDTDWATSGESFFWPTLGTALHEPTAANSQWVIQAGTLRAAGYTLAALWLAFGWMRLFRPRRPAVDAACLAVVLLLGCASRLESQGWALVLRPMLFASLAVLCGNLLRAGGALARLQAPAIVFLILGPASAQAPEPAIVYLVPGEAGALAAYAPKSLSAKLDALAKSPLPSAILTNALYSVHEREDLAAAEATFRIESNREAEQLLELPLVGIRLESAKLDGKTAHLDGSKADRFSLPLRGIGAHSLELRFAVPIASAGSDRELRFGAPDVPCCRIEFLAGLHARQLDIPTRKGSQTLATEADGLRLSADHGGGKTIQLRWRGEGTADGSKPNIAVREASIWDLGEDGSGCTSAFLYRIQGGTLSQLKFECPEALEIVSVHVRTLEIRPQSLGLKKWTAGKPANGWCPVTVALQNPSDGRIAMIVKLKPRKLLSVRPTLRVPRSTDAADAERESDIGFRLQGGLVIDSMTATAAIELPADSIGKDFTSIADLMLDKQPLQQFYRRTTNATPEWKPLLGTPALAKGDSLEIAYILGRKVEATGRITATIRDGAVLEFDFPAAFKLHELTGKNLGGWSRYGNRVTLWFAAGTTGAIEAIFHGSLAADGVGPNGTTLEGGIDLPLPRWLSSNGTAAKPLGLEIGPAPGFEIEGVAPNGFRNAGESPPTPGVWNYAADGTLPQPRVKVTVRHAESVRIAEPKALTNAVLKSVSEPAPKPADSTSEVSPAPVATHFERYLPWIGGIAWFLGLAIVARWPARRWPERIAFLGLLGAAALGFTSAAGIAMLALASLGLAARLRKMLT